jgi:predicted Zn-dependent peptidase
VIGIAGDIIHEQVIGEIEQAFAPWLAHPTIPSPTVDDAQEKPSFKFEPKDIEQVHLCLAVRGVSYFDTDRFALDLLNILLGEGMSSRLFLEIRERRGLAYAIHSYTTHFRDTGSLIIAAGVDPQRVHPTLQAVLQELEKLKETIPEEEFIRAKEFAKGRLLLRMEDSRNVASWLGSQELLTRHIFTLDEVLSIIDNLSPSDLTRVAQKVFNTNRLNLAMVGPPCKEEEIIKLLGI